MLSCCRHAYVKIISSFFFLFLKRESQRHIWTVLFQSTASLSVYWRNLLAVCQARSHTQRRVRCAFIKSYRKAADKLKMWTGIIRSEFWCKPLNQSYLESVFRRSLYYCLILRGTQCNLNGIRWHALQRLNGLLSLCLAYQYSPLASLATSRWLKIASVLNFPQGLK